jgi:hypothetical protein
MNICHKADIEAVQVVPAVWEFTTGLKVHAIEQNFAAFISPSRPSHQLICWQAKDAEHQKNEKLEPKQISKLEHTENPARKE